MKILVIYRVDKCYPFICGTASLVNLFYGWVQFIAGLVRESPFIILVGVLYIYFSMTFMIHLELFYQYVWHSFIKTCTNIILYYIFLMFCFSDSQIFIENSRLKSNKKQQFVRY